MSKSAARLKFFFHVWKEFTQDSLILQWIQGYQILFIEKVSQNCPPKQRNLSQSEVHDTSLAIKELMDKGAVSECEPCEGQFLSSYFLVQKSNGENRFILNLKNLNSFIVPPHFKMEDAKTVIRLLVPNCYMATIDRKDAFLSVPVANDF